jgi:hypothetical protein
MQLIESKTLTTSATSLEFASIPQSFTDLYIVINARSSRTDFPHAGLVMTINGSTANQTSRYLRGMAGIGVESLANEGSVFTLPANATTANSFSASTLYLPNYTSSVAKSFSVDDVIESNTTGTYDWLLRIFAGLWNSTAPITSLSFAAAVGNFVAGSTMSLYGITKGSGGATVS